MGKHATIYINIDKISSEDFGKMMQNIYNAVEEGDSRPAKDFFKEFSIINK